MLTPAEPPVEFDWHQIEAGPASGASVLLPKGTAISEAVTAGSYEQQIMRFVAVLVDQDSVCFDIGGHYGYYTLSLAKLAPRGQVHTFEPVAAHAERIEQSAERSGLANVTVHRSAVAGEVGRMTLQFAEVGAGDDSMAYLDAYGGVDTPAAHEHYRSFSRITVRTQTLDSLRKELPAPRFIKIDAEGAEVAILTAGRQLISESRPRLLVELHGIYEALQCAEILSGLKYRALLLTDQKKTMPILWVSIDDHEAFASVRRVLGRDPITIFSPAASIDHDDTASPSSSDQMS
jgi:FkbM family methyltransferase